MTVLIIFFGLFILLELITLVVLVLGFVKVSQWEHQLFQLKVSFPKQMKKLRKVVKAARASESFLDLLHGFKLPLMFEVAQFVFVAVTSTRDEGLKKSNR